MIICIQNAVFWLLYCRLNQAMDASDFFENDCVRMHIKGGILHGWYRKGAVIDTQQAKIIVQQRLRLLNGRSLPMIVFDEGIKEVKRDARIFLSEGDGIKGIKATVFVVTNPFTKIVVQFFLALNARNSNIPTKTVSSMEEGLDWLENYRN